MKHPLRISRTLCVLVAGAFALATGPAFAGNTWTGGGATNNWSDNNNWGGAAPAYGTLTFTTGGTQGTTSNNNSIGSMNQLLWTGGLAWTLNGSTTLSLFDNGGTQSKIENQSTGLVTINDNITYAATAGAAFAELNAVNGNITFGSGETLTVSGSQVAGIKLFGSGETINFNNTVNATGKYFGFTTGTTGNTVNIGGSFTSGDWYVMNGGTLNLAAGGSLTTSSLRLGGDFGNTGNQDQTKNGIFQLTSVTGGQTFGSNINTVTGNTSANLQVNSLNTSGTNTLNGGIFLDSQLKISQTTGGTLSIGAADVKGQLLLLLGGGTINLTGVVQSSVASGANSLQIGSNGIAGGPTVNISNADTYTGDTLVRAGTLQFATGGSITSTIRLGSTSGASVDASVNLTNATGGQTLANVINPVATAGSGNLSLNSQNTSNTNTVSGHIGLDRNLTITEAAGAGTLTLSNTHTAADATNVLGTDIKGNTLTLTPGAGSTINYTGNIYNSTGSGSVIMNGAGSLNLTGGGASTTGNTFSGGLVVKSGTVNASARADALGGGGTGAVTLGDSAGGSNNASILVSTTGLTYANPITLASTTTGTLTLGNTGTAISTTFSGGVTGSNNFTINENATSGTITLATALVNNFGTVTNTGAGTGTTTITAGVGSLVSGLTESSATSAFTISGAIAMNPGGGLTLTNNAAGATKALTVTGGITGSGNLVLSNNTATNDFVTLTTNSVNNSGAISNVGTGAGRVLITGGIGANVTDLIENSTTSDFRITTTAVTVNGSGTNFLNASGTSQLIDTAGVVGTGNVVLRNNSSTTSGVTFQTTAVNNIGTISNTGTGTGSASITSGGVGSNVTGLIENSLTSSFAISAGVTVNSAGTTISNNNGGGGSTISLTGGVTGTGNLVLQNNSSISGGITLGTAGTINNVGTITNSGVGTGATTLSAVVGSSVTGLTENSATSSLLLSGQNTYSSPTNLQLGAITLGVSSTITAGSLVSGPVGTGLFHIGSGTNAATLQTNVTNSTTRTVSNNISFDGDATFATTTTTGRIALDAFTGLTVPNTISLTRTNQFTINSGVTVDMLGSITGSSFGFTELGSGTLNIGGSAGTPTDTAANTFTGPITVSGGTLQLNKVAGTNAIAGDGNTATNDITVNTGGTLRWLSNEQVENHATITVAGGTVDLNGHTETLGSLVVNSGTFQTGANGISPNFNTPTLGLIGTTATTNFAGGTSTINTGGSINDGHIIVSGASTVIEVQQGGVMNLQSGGIGLVMNNATLTLDASNSTAGKLVLNGDVTTVASSGASSIVNGSTGSASGSIDMMTGTRNFYVNSGSTLTIGAQLTSPGGALNKGSSVSPSNDGLGTLILTGANTYAGGTTVGAGTLLANNSSGSATGAGAVMVNSGGTLGGTGSINAGSNNVNIGKDTVGMSPGNGGTITGANNGTVGALTLTATNVIFGGVSGDLGTYLVDLNASTSDLLAIHGNLDLSSAFDQITFQGTTGAASYQLITYSGLLSGSFDTVSSLPSGYTLSYLPGEIDLVTAVPETSTWVMGALALSTLLFSQRRRLRRG